MAVDVANWDRCKARLISLVSAEDEDAPYTGAVAPYSEFKDNEFNDALHEGDTAFVVAIISAAAHPFRNKFISGTPTTVASGGLVPDYMGASDKVECQITAGTAWVTGKQLRNMSRFQAILGNAEIPANTRERYYLREGGRVYTSGLNARVYAPTFNQDRSAPYTLQSPVHYERGVIAFAVAGLYKGTTEIQMHEFYLKQAIGMLQMASSGQTMLPEIEKYRRREG